MKTTGHGQSAKSFKTLSGKMQMKTPPPVKPDGDVGKAKKKVVPKKSSGGKSAY